MANRLAQETSPYLLEHANNPVDWYPWGTQALAKARSENKPILLSIGYSACHWCHVMARESFEDAEIAALMNRDFISIKVDREERPDLDQVYMRAVQGLTGSGGWPMTVFLLPDGGPGDGEADPACDGRRWHVRPAGRRISSIQRRRALVGPALRKDAVRQRPARPGVPGRLAADPRTDISAGGRRNPRVRHARDDRI